jgi:hypothetical protein
VTGLAAGEAMALGADAAARRLMQGRPGAYVETWRRHDEPGLCARIPHGPGHWLAIGAVGEVAAWVDANYQDPAAEVAPVPAAAGPAGGSSPGEPPAGDREGSALCAGGTRRRTGRLTAASATASSVTPSTTA